MNKNDVFTFKAPNGVEMQAVVLHFFETTDDKWNTTKSYICYAQNRLFSYIEKGHSGWDTDWKYKIDKSFYGKVFVNYAILPEYDKLLENHFNSNNSIDNK